MSNEITNEVDHLLHTVLVPAFQPNRSQYRKLEIAIKFINKSKNSVKQTTIRNENKYSLLDVPQQKDKIKKEIVKEGKHIVFF